MSPRNSAGRIAPLLAGLMLGIFVSTCSHQQDTGGRGPAAVIDGGARLFLPAPAFARTAGSDDGAANLADIAERAVTSVVNISATRTSKQTASPLLQDPFFRDFFGRDLSPFDAVPGDRRERSLGSGVIVTADGVILTSNHVVDSADELLVTLHDGRELKARIVGTDPQSDLAVLRLEGKPTGIQPIAFGSSAALRLGDVVLAIGNPFGVGQTVTMGIVSATGRTSVGLADYEDFIQTDAAINPGNSGGALINMRGELVGINTAILSRTGGNHGIGFAIPSDMAQPILDSLVKHGKVTRGWLGVTIQDLDRNLAEGLDIEVERGIVISDVSADSPAARAGLRRGDVIIAIDGKKVDRTAVFRNRIAALGPGKTARLDVVRDGKTRSIEVKLGSQADGVAAAAPRAQTEAKQGLLAGVKVAALSPSVRRDHDVDDSVRRGVVVTEVETGSRAQSIGLRPGDVIVEIDRTPVDSIAQFEKLAAKAKGSVLLLVHRGGGTLYLALRQ